MKDFYRYTNGRIVQYDEYMNENDSYKVPSQMQGCFTEGQEISPEEYDIVAIPNVSFLENHKLDHQDFMNSLDNMNAYAKLERLRNLMSPMYNFISMMKDDNITQEQVIKMYFGEGKTALSDTVKDIVKILKS